ncbi:unnamed protein product, partial [Diplocarpon coronariae]
MARRGLLARLALALGLFGTANSQSSAPFIDEATGITFQQVTDGAFTFGIALPEASS